MIFSVNNRVVDAIKGFVNVKTTTGIHSANIQPDDYVDERFNTFYRDDFDHIRNLSC